MRAYELDLHEAMVVVMVRNRRFTMLATELATAINEDGLYVRGDKKPLPHKQVVARARRKTYKDLFRVRGPRGAKTVSLRPSKRVAKEPVV